VSLASARQRAQSGSQAAVDAVSLPSGMTPNQSRAARGWLGWSQGELAKRANVSLSTVHDFERGQRTPPANNLASMRRAIDVGGVMAHVPPFPINSGGSHAEWWARMFNAFDPSARYSPAYFSSEGDLPLPKDSGS
jgi:DNA-binding transcriptional regulator YiaG